jgi:hypothetical protein
MRVSDLPALLMQGRRARTPFDRRVVVHPSARDSFCELGLTAAIPIGTSCASFSATAGPPI